MAEEFERPSLRKKVLVGSSLLEKLADRLTAVNLGLLQLLLGLADR